MTANVACRIITLGKVAKHVFPTIGPAPMTMHAGDTFYLIGLLTGLILWGFAVVWFIVAAIMIATAGSFPFNMGWWGFIFPVGKSKPGVASFSFDVLTVVLGIFTLLTISIGEQFELKFFKILSCVSFITL
jgi:tellurite resistance protein TehA-like permease